jgi:RNA polymerase sigma factor (sigma-70 family)
MHFFAQRSLRVSVNLSMRKAPKEEVQGARLPGRHPRGGNEHIFLHDPELLEAYRRGVPLALERVYRAYRRPIERYVQSLARGCSKPELSQPSAVADFVQEVFARVLSPSARRNYDARRDFGGYVTIIARNCFIDTLRALKREAFQSHDTSVFHIDDSLPPLTDTLEPKIAGVMEDYLGGLSPDLRQVYERRFALSRSQDDTCTALGMSRSSLRTKERHLRKGLRRALARAGVSLSSP